MPLTYWFRDGLEEFLVDQHGVTGYLVPPRDASALAAAVTPLLKDPGLAASMGDAGRRRVLVAHGPERMVDEFLQLWQSLGAGRRRA